MRGLVRSGGSMARRAMSIRHPRDLQNEPLACSGSTPWPPSRSRHRAQPPSSLGRKKLRLGAGTFVKIKASMRRACKQHAPPDSVVKVRSQSRTHHAASVVTAPSHQTRGLGPACSKRTFVMTRANCGRALAIDSANGLLGILTECDRMRPNGRGHHGQGPEPGWPSQSQSQDHAAAPALPATRTSSVGRPVARCERRSGPRRFDERADDAMG